jgi:TRAP-type C4-dicarboxylate transport system substrate-binding protein
VRWFDRTVQCAGRPLRMLHFGPCVVRLTAAAMMAMPVLLCPFIARADEPVKLKVVGGLAGVSQYERLEKPFWEHRIEALSNGSIQAEIHTFDRSGLPGQEMLQLMRLGIVPFGTALLAVVSGDEPELNAVDLPALNPDMQALRRTVGLYRLHLQEMLRTKYGVELLAVYAYPAQVIFCAKPFTGLSDLAGRRIRTSSVGQSEMMAALGAIPVLTPFAEIVNSVRTGVVDCAITGTLSGNEIGLPNVTSYIYPMAISWGLSFFGANDAVWTALRPDLRATLKEAIAGLEREIWDAADRETAVGLACDIGGPDCNGEHSPGHMMLVPVTSQDEATRKRLLVESVLPGWIQRCGTDCVAAWNRELAPALGIKAAAD